MQNNSNNQTFPKRILSFITSDNFFVWLIGAIILAFWVTDTWIIGVIVLCALAAVVLIFSRDTSKLLSILFMFVLIISKNRHNMGGLGWIIYMALGLLFGGIIFHVIYYRPKFLPLFSEGRLKGFTLALLLITLPMALGGIGRGGRNAIAVLLVTGIMLAMSICFLFFLSTTNKRNGEAMMKYILLTMFVTGIVISIQMLIFYYRLGSYEAVEHSMITKDIDLGWAGANNIAPMLSMCLPANFYYAIKKKRYGFLFITLALVQYVIILSTGCRGTMLFTTMALPFMLSYTMAKTENKLGVGLTVSVCFCIGVALTAYYGPQVSKVLGFVLNKGISDSGRDKFYLLAWNTFKDYPIFGAGWDFRLGELAGDGYSPYWYHSTPFQILANMGLFGLVCFAIFTFWRYRAILTKGFQVEKFVIAAGLILFELYGLIDVNYFGPTFFISMLIMSFAVEKSLTAEQCNPKLFFKGVKFIRAGIKKAKKGA
jgi:heme/copper-type cytochrome/quinol oxidase subunit 4